MMPGCTNASTILGLKDADKFSDVLSLGCLESIIVNVLNIALGFLGAVTLIMLLYGSIKFIISRGDPKAIEGAQKTITYAIIGAVIVLGSFIIINIVTTSLGLGTILDKFTIYQ